METSHAAKDRRTAKAAKTVDQGSVREGAAKGLAVKVQRDARRGHDHNFRERQSVFTKMYRATPLERIGLIREGVSAVVLLRTGEEMGVAKERMIAMLHFTRATVNRRIKTKEALPTEYSERIIGLQKLIGQVEIMVAESGDPTGFNAAHWVADWLERPVAALNNAKPADFMDTIEGQELVSSLLAKMQSGAYA